MNNVLNIDIRTIILLLFAGNLFSLFILIAYTRKSLFTFPYHYFILGKLLQSPAWVLLGFRGIISDVLSIHLGNILLIGGFALEALALTSARTTDRRWFKIYLLLYLAGISLFLTFDQTPWRRVGFASVATLILFFTAAVAMFRHSAGSTLMKSMAIMYGAFSILSILRAGYAFFSPVQLTLTSSHWIQTCSFMALFIIMMVSGIGFLLILKEQDTKRLTESEDRYRTLVENAQEGIAIVQDKQIIFANSRLLEMIGASDKSLLGRSFTDFLFPEDLGSVVKDYEKCIQDGTPFRAYDLRINGINGIRTWAFISASRIFLNGRPALLNILSNIDDLKRMEAEREKLIADLQQALSEIKTLSGMLPICASCKKIRDDQGYWYQIERYIKEHSEVVFSHSICPDCSQKLYPEYHHPEEQ